VPSGKIIEELIVTDQQVEDKTSAIRIRIYEILSNLDALGSQCTAGL